MNTIIVIEQTRRTGHEIIIKGEVPDVQLDMLGDKLARMTCLDDIMDIVSRLGLEVIGTIDTEGNEISSEFEYLDDRQEADI